MIYFSLCKRKIKMSFNKTLIFVIVPDDSLIDPLQIRGAFENYYDAQNELKTNEKIIQVDFYQLPSNINVTIASDSNEE